MLQAGWGGTAEPPHPSTPLGTEAALSWAGRQGWHRVAPCPDPEVASLALGTRQQLARARGSLLLTLPSPEPHCGAGPSSRCEGKGEHNPRAVLTGSGRCLLPTRGMTWFPSTAACTSVAPSCRLLGEQERGATSEPISSPACLRPGGRGPPGFPAVALEDQAQRGLEPTRQEPQSSGPTAQHNPGWGRLSQNRGAGYRPGVLGDLCPAGPCCWDSRQPQRVRQQHGTHPARSACP